MRYLEHFDVFAVRDVVTTGFRFDVLLLQSRIDIPEHHMPRKSNRIDRVFHPLSDGQVKDGMW
ncbi:MAG: hypothetical protein ABFD97_24005 [Syntrophobacter sp.]